MPHHLRTTQRQSALPAENFQPVGNTSMPTICGEAHTAKPQKPFLSQPKRFQADCAAGRYHNTRLPLLSFSCFTSNGQGCGTKTDLLTENQCISFLCVYKKRKQCKPAEGLGSLAAGPAFTPADFKHLWRHNRNMRAFSRDFREWFCRGGGREAGLSTSRTSVKWLSKSEIRTGSCFS